MIDTFRPMAEFARLMQWAFEAGWRIKDIEYADCGSPTYLVLVHPDVPEPKRCASGECIADLIRVE